jgi:hypothetical protein
MAISVNSLPRILRQFWLVAGALSLFFVAAAAIAREFDLACALAAGFAVGTGDNVIMLRGIAKGAKKSWARAFVLMKKNMLIRLVFVGLACFLGIKARINMLCFFVVFFSMHMLCLLFLVINAWEGAKPESAERSENCGSGERNN